MPGSEDRPHLKNVQVKAAQPASVWTRDPPLGETIVFSTVKWDSTDPRTCWDTACVDFDSAHPSNGTAPPGTKGPQSPWLPFPLAPD